MTAKLKKKTGPKKSGQGNGESKHSPRRIELAKATTIALDLKCKQITVQEIRARITEMKWKFWTPWKTDKAVYDALNKGVAALGTENAERLRYEIHMGYAAVINAHLKQAIDKEKPSVRSGELATRTLERLAKLYGLETILVEVKDGSVLSLLVPDGFKEKELPDYTPEEIED